MNLWVQHGHGKGDKIDLLASDGALSGVVLSPANENPGNLESTVTSLVEQGVTVLVDPQLYVHMIPDGFARWHSEHYGPDFGSLTPYLTAAEIDRHVDDVLDLNRRLGVESVVTPAPYLDSFVSQWAPISLQYARATLAKTEARVLVSLVISDSAFGSWDLVHPFLDEVTKLDAAGIYLIVGHRSNYPVRWDPVQLSNVLRAIHILGEYNDYEVIWGYSDIVGLCGLAAGASGGASGWYHGLRQWSPEKWVPRDGGSAASPRILIPGILNPVAKVEAESLASSSYSQEIFGDADLLSMVQDASEWGTKECWMQHLYALSELYSTVRLHDNPRDRVNSVIEFVDSALVALSGARGEGAPFSNDYQARLQVMKQALEKFAHEARL